MDRHWIDHPLFVFGHPKGGTTLVTALLDGHPELMVLPGESSLYSKVFVMLRRAGPILTSREVRAAYAAEIILRFTNLGRTIEGLAEVDRESKFDSSLYASELREALLSTKLDRPEIVRAVVSSFRLGSPLYRDNLSLRRWVEKTPTHAAHFESMLADFPKARFVHVVRDPRDNWISYRRKHPTHRLESFVYNWRRLAREALRNSKSYGQQRYLAVRYEDLVRDATGSIRHILSSFGLSEHVNGVSPTVHGVPWFGNSMFDDKGAQVYSGAIQRFRTLGDPDHVAYIENAARSEMLHFGYEPTSLVDSRLRLRGFVFDLRLRARDMLKPDGRWGFYHGRDYPDPAIWLQNRRGME